MTNTLTLGENDAEKKSSGRFAAVISGLSNTKNKLRRFFIQANEKSPVVMLLEQLYYHFLACKIRVVATFFLVFSFVSLVLGAMLSTSLSSYVSSESTFESVIIALIGLILFTSSKKVEDILSGSVFLSPMNIVYSQQGIISSYSTEGSSFSAYSTAFFIGIIGGIISLIFPASVIMSFILLLVYTLFIFNRPECGILMLVLLLPFFSVFYIIMFSFITFFALIHKYLIGKRHINFSIADILSAVAVMFIIIRALCSDILNVDVVTVLAYVLVFVVFVTTSNLTRSTSMYRRTLAILVSLSRFYALTLATYYLASLFFGADVVQAVIIKCELESFLSAITGLGFSAPVLAISVPINLSVILSSNKKSESVKGFIYLILMLGCTILVASLPYVILILTSCVVVLFFLNKKFAFLLLSVFPVSYGIIKLVKMIPDRYVMNFLSTQSHGWNPFVSSFRNTAFFGRGLEKTQIGINNSSLNIVNEFGIIGTLLISSVFIFAIIKTIRSLVVKKNMTNRFKLFAIGQIISCFSYVCCSFIINSLFDIRLIFLFSVVFSLAYSSVKCYEADYIDEHTVREYIS